MGKPSGQYGPGCLPGPYRRARPRQGWRSRSTYKQWNLTIEGAAPHEIYVARRPFDWTGEGDRWERITAPTRRELLRLLGHRIQGTDPTDASSVRDACVLPRIL